jgi:hypothetical protein
MKPLVLVYISFGIIVLAMIGCKREESRNCTDCDWSCPLQSQIFLLNGPISYGDSISIPGFLVHTYIGGQIVPGARLFFSTLRSNSQIVFTNSALMDTTDSRGRISFIYEAFQVRDSLFDVLTVTNGVSECLWKDTIRVHLNR